MEETAFNDLSKVRREDIPEEFFKLIYLCGGQNMYVPKPETLTRNARDRDIRARFNGGNYKALAAQFRLSERQIRKIINGTRT